jgi:hypothetical protein
MRLDVIRSLVLFVIIMIVPYAAKAERIAILELRSKEMPPVLLETVQARLNEALKAEGYKIVSEEEVAKKMREINVPPGCTLGPCLSRIGRALFAERALFGGISSQGSSYDLVLTMMETGGGSVLAQVTGRCEVCNYKEVEDLVLKGAQDLHRQMLVFLSTHSVLVIRSKPSLAKVLLDNLPAGETPMTLVVSPGYHLIEVASSGGIASKEMLSLEPGKTRLIYADLWQKLPSWLDEGVSPKRQRRLPSWLKWTVLGASISLVGIGAGAWAMDGRETSDGRYLYDTSTLGITFVSVGIATAIGSGILYLLDHQAESQPRTTARRHGER